MKLVLPLLALQMKRLNAFSMEILRTYPGLIQIQCLIQSIISTTSSKSKTISKISSQSSHDSLQKIQEAAAEVAASQEVIKIMKTQHQYEEEIRKLEAEDERLTSEREAQEREIEADNARKRA